MSKNYYHILEVSPTATAQEIKAAYKRLALRFHPDKNPGSPHAEERFKQINDAYQVLSNPRRRAAFDQQQDYERRQRQAAAYTNPRYHHTRPPAGFKERHYQQRAQHQRRLSKRDIKIALGVVLLVVLLVLGLKLGWDSMAEGRAFKQAQQAAANGEWSQAEAAYSTYLMYQPEAGKARLQRAAIRQRHLQDPQGAAIDYSYLINSSQNPSPAWFVARGDCYLDEKKMLDALLDFEMALKLDSTLVTAFRGRALVHLQMEDDWPAAIQDLTVFLKHPTGKAAAKVEAYLYRAYAFYRTQEYDLAWQDTEAALAADAFNAKAFYLQAVISRAQNGDNSLTCDLLTKAAQLGFAMAQEEKARYCQ
ncbi:DnaJ domain-containing protein [Rufibacter sp. LB8]|uniref:DnaJ domain-containing protein n=1 Tax=Rufibacter sp. LB8 TaxID=2777781 RepID=UPI00178C78A5|nr:DnaJ domain-containing protein [Rufibacter sp. LB8]